jgi:hypothetical protein
MTNLRRKSEVYIKRRDSGIIAFSMSDHGHSPEKLYQMLEDELFKINKK